MGDKRDLSIGDGILGAATMLAYAWIRQHFGIIATDKGTKDAKMWRERQEELAGDIVSLVESARTRLGRRDPPDEAPLPPMRG